MAERRADSQAL